MATPPPPGQIPLVNANFSSIAIASFLYGNFYNLTIVSLYLHYQRSKARSSSGVANGPIRSASSAFRREFWLSPMVIGSILLWTMVTAHWFLTVVRGFKAFVFFDGGKDAAGFYANVGDVTHVVQNVFLIGSVCTGDAMIIYRMYVIWGRNFRIAIFPLCTLLGLVICGLGGTYQFAIYHPGQTIFLIQAGRWISSNGAFTLATNVYCTSMIAIKLIRADGTARKHGSSPVEETSATFMSVLAVIVESAGFYTLYDIFFIAAYESHNNLEFPLIDCFPSVSGLSFMLINVRVALGWAHSASEAEHSDSKRLQQSTIQFNRSTVPEVLSVGTYSHSQAIEITSKEASNSDILSKRTHPV